MKLIDFDFLDSHCNDVTLQEALTEIRRENKTRRSAYERWAKNQPSKIQTFKTQFTRSAAIEAVLATMSEKEWQRRLTAAFGQGELFT